LDEEGGREGQKENKEKEKKQNLRVFFPPSILPYLPEDRRRLEPASSCCQIVLEKQ
jgi:hypothetical protein